MLFYITVEGNSLVLAGVSRGSVSAADPLRFTFVFTNKGNQWNYTSSIFTTAESYGLYLVGLSVGVQSGNEVDFAMVLSGQRHSGMTRTSKANTFLNIIARDVIVPLYAADTVHVSSRHEVYGLLSYMDTSITIFSISNSMANNLVAFSVARETTFSGSAYPVQFDVTLYNPEFYYDDTTHTFTAPSAGVYFFSFSLGLIAGGVARLTLHKNGEPLFNILRTSTIQTGTDTIGRSVMMELEQHDTVYISNPDGFTVRSSELKETSFSGFNYQPRHGNMVSSDQSL